MARLVMSMGGRAADRLVIGEPLSGAIERPEAGHPAAPG